MIHSFREMVWGVDWIHLVGVGVGVWHKNTHGGSLCLERCIFATI